jgi:hypothetical protein
MKYIKKRESHSNKFYKNDTIDCISQQKSVDIYFNHNKTNNMNISNKNTNKFKLFSKLIKEIKKIIN